LTGEKFAVKAFSKEYLSTQEKSKEAMDIEISVLKCLDHPNIIKFEELHESENSLYLVMELLEGKEVFDMNQGKLKSGEARYILRGILQGLQYLAEKGIVHRDLKPQNLIFQRNNCEVSKNTVKIVDFGLSTFVDAEEYLFKRCGTPGFVAPEIINADKNDPNLKFHPKSDIYSAGIIFYFMLAGNIPFDGESFGEVLANNKQAVIDFEVSELNKASPEALDLLKKMLRKDIYTRLSASECLNHPYFQEFNETTLRRDSIDLGVGNIYLKSKMEKVKVSKFQDSFKLAKNSPANSESQDTTATASPQMRFRISSFNSKGYGQRTTDSGNKDSVYKRTLMKGVDF
jgi:serine/threonine protein kinase